MIIEPQRRKELREKYLCVLCAFAVKKSYSRTMCRPALEYTMAPALDFRRGKYKYKVRMTAGGGFLGVAGSAAHVRYPRAVEDRPPIPQ